VAETLNCPKKATGDQQLLKMGKTCEANQKGKLNKLVSNNCMKNSLIKLFGSALFSLICIIGTMVLTTGCDKDELYCDPGYKYLGKYSLDKTCAGACTAGKTYVRYDDDACCCEK